MAVCQARNRPFGGAWAEKNSVHVANCVDELFGRDETTLRAADEDAADKRTLEVGDADAVLAVAEYPHQVLRRDAVLRVLARNKEVCDGKEQHDEGLQERRESAVLARHPKAEVERPRGAEHLRKELGYIEDDKRRDKAPGGATEARAANELDCKRGGSRRKHDAGEVVADEKRRQGARHVGKRGMDELRLATTRA